MQGDGVVVGDGGTQHLEGYGYRLVIDQGAAEGQRHICGPVVLADAVRGRAHRHGGVVGVGQRQGCRSDAYRVAMDVVAGGSRNGDGFVVVVHGVGRHHQGDRPGSRLPSGGNGDGGGAGVGEGDNVGATGTGEAYRDLRGQGVAGRSAHGRGDGDGVGVGAITDRGGVDRQRHPGRRGVGVSDGQRGAADGHAAVARIVSAEIGGGAGDGDRLVQFVTVVLGRVEGELSGGAVTPEGDGDGEVLNGGESDAAGGS